jgi:alkylation response protein AidB-like acyl-CoA dehydrogenase
MGVLGLAVPSESGGEGGSLVDAAIAFEELGRALYWGPLWGTVAVSATLLAALAEEAPARDLLKRLVVGETTAALAEEPKWAPNTPPLTAGRGPDGSWRISGHVAQVVDGDADVLLVCARVGAESYLFAVEHDAPGVNAHRLSTLDMTRAQAAVTFDKAAATCIATSGAEIAVRRARNDALVLLAAEMLGVAERIFETAVAHAKTRYQFGRPIGSFQAVKHRFAAMYVQLENVRSLVYHAAWTSGGSDDGADFLPSLVKAKSSELATETAGQCLQIFGGMGFTWEHHAHLYYKRAVADALLFGTPDQHWDRVATAIIDQHGAVDDGASARG